MLSRTGFKETKDPGMLKGPGEVSVRKWDLGKRFYMACGWRGPTARTSQPQSFGAASSLM